MNKTVQKENTMNKTVQKEVKELINKLNLNCTIDEFENKVDWYWISYYQKLSEEFIREFENKVDWNCISRSQNLSEEFIREFKNEVNWGNISTYQKLSESFIKEFKNKVRWLDKEHTMSKRIMNGYKMNWFTRMILSKICRSFVIQGPEHKAKIIAYYDVMRNAAEKEFREENKISLDTFLSECHSEANKSYTE
jgi:hypothetical protein